MTKNEVLEIFENINNVETFQNVEPKYINAFNELLRYNCAEYNSSALEEICRVLTTPTDSDVDLFIKFIK